MPDRPPRLSIIVPALDEAGGIAVALERLAPARARGAEVLVVDGGSSDATVAVARPLADRVLESARGRAVQMNTGAAAAAGDVLLFLHADCLPPQDCDRLVLAAVAGEHLAWGRFDVRIASSRRLLGCVAALMNLRSRATGIATGDQGIFATRALFDRAGGFPPIALMEDIALSRAMRRIVRPRCLEGRIETSARRWEKGGVLRTIVLMWRLRLAYFFGADPGRLAVRYGRGR